MVVPNLFRSLNVSIELTDHYSSSNLNKILGILIHGLVFASSSPIER
jgi:membrane-anchored protein YejM (alkaline phosphatase superfamily)